MSAAACGLPERSARPRQGCRSWPSNSNGLQLCRWRKGQQAVVLWLHLDEERSARSTRCLSRPRHRGHQAGPHPAAYAPTSGSLGRDPAQLAHKCRSSTGIGTALPCTASAALQTGRTRPSDLCLHSNPHSTFSRAACRGVRRAPEPWPCGHVRKAPKCAMRRVRLSGATCSVSVRSFCMCCDNIISAILPCGLVLLENHSGRPFTGANDLASADAFAPAAATVASKTKAHGTFDLCLL